MTIGQDQELGAFLDRATIQELIFRYSDAVTRADYAQLETVFWPDAVWESPLLGMHFDSARAFIDAQIEGSKDLSVLIHTSHCPVVELLSTDRARATTTVHEMFMGVLRETGAYGVAGSEINVEQRGIYFDEIRKADGAWRFTSRRFEPFLIAPGSVVGQVTAGRPLTPPW